MPAPRRRKPRRPKRDWGRLFAVALSVAFALVGLVPLTAGVLVRTDAVRIWAARTTAALIERELGVHASYEVEVQAWPMVIALQSVRVEATDGGEPFFEAERAEVRPRPFSLLGGRLDAGDVQIIGPRIRAVVRDGELENLRVRKPPSTAPRKPTEAPLASLSVTDGSVDLTIDGVHGVARQIDVDVSAEDEGAFEVALRVGPGELTRTHPMPGREDTDDAVDEDVLCRLDARLRIDDQGLLVRRLLLQGSADFDPDPGTAPSCRLSPTDWRAFEIRAGALRLTPKKDAPGLPFVAQGRVRARLPAPLVHRFVDIAHVTGSISLDVEAEYDGASKLPRVTGHVRGDRPGIDGKVFAKTFDLDVKTTPEGAIHVANLEAAWGDGRVLVPEATILPFEKGVPLTTSPIDIDGIEFHALLRDLGVHPRAHVAWTLVHGRFESFNGTLSPVALDGPLTVATRGFEVFNRPVVEPVRGHMIGVKEGTVRGVFQVRPDAIVLNNFLIDTPRSHLRATVSLSYRSYLDLEVAEGSTVDLADINPILDIPIGGQLTLAAGMHGPFENPKLLGNIAVKDFSFGGFPIGDVESAAVHFQPLVLELADAHVKHGLSRIRADRARFAFDEGADVLVDAEVDTRDAPHLYFKDFFEVFRFDKDPRFVPVDGNASGKARVHYALGGKEDRCGGGRLEVRADAEMKHMALFGERYEGGSVDVDFVWDDQAAGDAGMTIDLHSASLRKGGGSVLGQLTVRHGGVVQGSAIATGLPIAKLDALGGLAKMLDGNVSMVAQLGGTISDLEARADVSVSRLRVGTSSMPPSRFHLAMERTPTPRKILGRTRCGNERSPPFDEVEWAKDVSGGVFRMNGQLFDGQIKLEDVTLTRQTHKVLAGKLVAAGLDLGTLTNIVPVVAFGGGSKPTGSLSATLDVKSLPLDAPSRGDVTLVLEDMRVARDKLELKLVEKSRPVRLIGNELSVPEVRFRTKAGGGLSAVFVAGGKVTNAMTAPELDVGLSIEPVELSRFSSDLVGLDRVGGTFDATLRMTGPAIAPKYTGHARLRKGEFLPKGAPVAAEDVNVDVTIVGTELRIEHASAKVGGGTVDVTGRVPLRGKDAGAAVATIKARGVKLPVAEGVNLTADADLEATYRASAEKSNQKNLPEVKGTVSLTSFSYTRPIALSVDLSQLSKGQRTQVDTYDPANDKVRFTINIVSPKPLRFRNNLVDMELDVVSPGLVLSGTNQRFGARGQLRILPDSKLELRSNEFLVREGYIRFEDPTKIAPKVDMTAQTDYRRYSSPTDMPSAAAATEASPSSSSTPGSSVAAIAGTAGMYGAGIWHILLHAHGDVENLKINLTSDPPLSQDDIVLLLTIGMTRAEIDRSSSSLGESVGLEAISALTGADRAVQKVVPLIDEFRFGSGYSSRTGRTEPEVTVGKRLNENVRASVTTGITDNEEVKSNLEWKLNRTMSVEGSYDNVNDVSSSLLGNIGADLVWRIEFE